MITRFFDVGVHKICCPFCRAPGPTSNEEVHERTATRIDLNDAIAIYNHGTFYASGCSRGMYGLPQDRAKAVEL